MAIKKAVRKDTSVDDFGWLTDPGVLDPGSIPVPDVNNPGGDYGGMLPPPDATPTQPPSELQTPDTNPGGPGTVPGAGTPSGSGSVPSSAISSLAHALGISPTDLMTLLAIGGGALATTSHNNATNDMTQHYVDAINNATGQATGIINGQAGKYQPYQDAGASALAKLQGQPLSNIAGNFSPVSSGGALSGNFKPIGNGRGMTLAQLAGR